MRTGEEAEGVSQKTVLHHLASSMCISLGLSQLGETCQSAGMALGADALDHCARDCPSREIGDR
jgi:hypothetical protein